MTPPRFQPRRISGGINIKQTYLKLFAIAIVAMLAAIVPAGMFGSDSNDSSLTLGAAVSGTGTEADPYQFAAIAGDQYSYTMTANVNATYSVTSGSIADIGLTLDGNVLSGTVKEGKEKICITATSNDGGPVRQATQWISYSIYNLLKLTAAPSTASWAGTAYEYTFSITDVDPDATGETTVSLNSEATTAGFAITKVSETSYKLTRSAEKNTVGTVKVTITAASTTSGIAQSKSATATISTYDTVGITSTPSGHQGSGLTVWLIEDKDQSWTYTVTAKPSDATLSASGLNANMTFTDGVLTVSRAAPFADTNVTITATSTAGGSTETATQVLKIKNWTQIAFNSAPSLSDIKVTVDGRTISASVVADNYSSITWVLSDGTVYEGTKSINHTFADDGAYDIRVTVKDEIGREKTSSTSVVLGEGEDPAPAPGGDDPKKEDSDYCWYALIGTAVGVILVLVGLLGIGINSRGIAVAAIGVIIAALGLLFFFNVVSFDEIKDWFSGLLNGKEKAHEA